jgi:ferredoxin
MPIIKLQPGERKLECPRKVNLLQFLQSQEIPVGNACGGKGLCASCKVQVLQGERSLSRPNDKEIELAERNHLQKSERIACQSRVLGDIEITTSYWSEIDLKKEKE